MKIQIARIYETSRTHEKQQKQNSQENFKSQTRKGTQNNKQIRKMQTNKRK